ncbi:hypothetical protein [Kineococcus gypseus]|uniref:hypothetical protein n=1 Tax=Kineococcus gypseus TaxID=1637102 RepID=UPI003D7D11FF
MLSAGSWFAWVGWWAAAAVPPAAEAWLLAGLAVSLMALVVVGTLRVGTLRAVAVVVLFSTVAVAATVFTLDALWMIVVAMFGVVATVGAAGAADVTVLVRHLVVDRGRRTR